MANKLTTFSIENWCVWVCVCVWRGGGGGGGGGRGVGFDFTIAHSLINLVPGLHIYYLMILL